jgi:UDP-N-acetyl-2-amino-2-deoxyglucuronate dehydrogenase
VDKKIRFAVIGQGHIGKRHAEMIRRNSECELVAVCDILPKEKTQTEEHHTPYFDDAAKMLAAHSDIDVVCICSPNGLHGEHSLPRIGT